MYSEFISWDNIRKNRDLQVYFYNHFSLCHLEMTAICYKKSHSTKHFLPVLTEFFCDSSLSPLGMWFSPLKKHKWGHLRPNGLKEYET
jgi:hypothetical protein